MFTFADDTANVSSSSCLTQMEKLFKRLIVKLNANKKHMTFTRGFSQCPAVFFNDTQIPKSDYVLYLGCRVTWSLPTKHKRQGLR